MTAYLLTYVGVFEKIRVRTYPDVETAKAVYSQPGEDPRESGLYAGAPEDIDLTGPGLVSLYNSLTGSSLSKFETRTVGKKRIFDILEERYQHQPHEAAPAAASPSEASTGEAAATTTEGDEDMAKKGKKVRVRAKRVKGEAKPRGVGKPAGKVSDLRLIREGTDRAKVLKLMTGRHTSAQIAQETGLDEKKVGTIIFCLSRDCGIGYKFGEKGQVEAIYPGDKGYKDVIKKAAE